MTYTVGDPNHLGVHNDLVAQTRQAAQRAGVDVVLPDDAHLGDTGHVDDHNLLAAALAEIAAKGGGMTWAKVTGGTVGTVTNADGSVDEIHTFTADSTMVVESEGYAMALVVGGGGGGGKNEGGGGGAGGVEEGVIKLRPGTYTVRVGTGGAATTADNTKSANGTASYIAGSGYTGTGSNYADGVIWANHGLGANPNQGHVAEGGGFVSGGTGRSNTYAPGRTSTMTGTAVEYGCAGGCGVGSNPGTVKTTPGSGGGGGRTSTAGTNGQAGIVVVRVQQLPPTAPQDQVAASGGTESTFTGDGTNGVAGQRYRQHVFTASSTLTVSQGGTVDVLLVGGGGGGGNFAKAGGGGGSVMQLTGVALSAGSVPVIVGQGGATGGYQGGYSAIGGLSAPGGGGGANRDSGSGNYSDGGNGGSGGGNVYGGLGGKALDPRYGYDATPLNNGDGTGGAGAGGTNNVKTGGPGKAVWGVTYAKGGDSATGKTPVDSTPNTGNGGDGTKAGGSGVVIVRYPID